MTFTGEVAPKISTFPILTQKQRISEKSPLQFPIVQQSNCWKKIKSYFSANIKLKSLTSLPFGGPMCEYIYIYIEVRDFLHGIFGSCTRYPRGLTRWAELLGRRRRRRRQVVLPGGDRPPDPQPFFI